jgi:hypothetical protein
LDYFLDVNPKTATVVAVIEAKSNSICHGNAIQMARNAPFSAKKA